MNKNFKCVILLMTLFLMVGFLSGAKLTSASLNVVLVEPANNSTLVIQPSTHANVTFVYNVSSNHSNAISLNCSLYLNSILNDTSSNINASNTSTSHQYNFSEMLCAGNFFWYINCSDPDNNENASSSIRNLTIDTAPVWNASSNYTITINEDQTNATPINLSDYAFDADANDTLTFSVYSENTSQVDCSIENVSLLYFHPASNWNGVAVCGVKVSDGVASNKTNVTVNVTPVEDPPVIESISDKTVNVKSKFTLQVHAYDPDNDPLTYSLSTKPGNMTISSTGLIEWWTTSSDRGSHTVVVNVSDNQGNYATESFDLNVITPQMIEISDIDSVIDGVSDKNLGEGDTLDVEPNSNVALDIEVENLYSHDDHVYIENAVLSATIVGIDDGDDVEEETSEFKIRYDDSVRKTLNLKIPLKVEEGEYDLIIKVEDEDELGYTQSDEVTLHVNVRKDKHDVRIRNYEVYPSQVSCDRHVELNAEVRNLGTTYEDEVVFSAQSSTLNINERSNFELDDDPWADENYKKVHYEFDIPATAKAGNYTIILRSYYSTDELSDYKILHLMVSDCQTTPTTPVTPTTPSNATQQNTTIVVQTPTTPFYPAVGVQEKPFTETTGFMILLIAANVLIVGLILILIAKLLLANK